MSYTVTMESRHKPRSGVALGGLGCGWFELRQDGTFQNWGIFNNRPAGRGRHFTWDPNTVLFFLVRYQEEGREPRICLLQIEPGHGAAAIEGHEFQYIFPWLGGVDRIRYEATVPFIDLDFEERSMPLRVKLRAWSPFIPGDEKNSSLPVAFFDFSIESTSERPVDVSILATMRNCVGYETKAKAYSARTLDGEGWRMFEMSCENMDPSLSSYGSMGVASLHPDSTAWVAWAHPHPYYEQLLRCRELPEVNDLAGRNGVDPATGKLLAKTECFSTIGRTVTLGKSGEKFAHSFAATWDFPNRYARVVGDKDGGPIGYLEGNQLLEQSDVVPHIEGHYYSNFFSSASDVASYAISHREYLKREAERFHQAFYDATLPGYLLDQVNSQLNTFRTSSWFTKQGDFGILEGLSPTQSFAGLATTDVAMYGGVATASLFPNLEKAVIRAHIRFQNPNGAVCHSLAQNFREMDPREANAKRLDMPGQFAYMALRAGLYDEDRVFLSEVWPAVKRALDYVLRERDRNGDLLPDMEGVMCSYDNFPMFGVAPYVATQWLAAISAAVLAAKLLGDAEAETRYAGVLERGSEALEAATWNGAYFRLSSEGTPDEGCLTDQIIGHWAVQQIGLPSFLKPEHVAKAIRSILAMNFKPDQGLRNCQWPGDGFLHAVADDCWVDQANTCWTGVELAFASMLIYEGFVEDGFQVVKNVDDRYRRFGMYWDHQEFGGHYFRAMSAWAVLPAALGFTMRDGVITFDPKVEVRPCCLLFVTPHGYGHYRADDGEISLHVLSGSLRAREIRIRKPAGWNIHEAEMGGSLISSNGDADFLRVLFSAEQFIPAGEQLTFRPLASRVVENASPLG